MIYLTAREIRELPETFLEEEMKEKFEDEKMAIYKAIDFNQKSGKRTVQYKLEIITEFDKPHRDSLVRDLISFFEKLGFKIHFYEERDDGYMPYLSVDWSE